MKKCGNRQFRSLKKCGNLPRTSCTKGWWRTSPLANLGAVYENVVTQELVAHGHQLFYHTWPKKGANRNYEIDFIVPDGQKISPIEVKSSRYKTHASLDDFGRKFSARIGRQYLVYTKDLQKDGPVTCIPTYMSSLL
jgi:predicted AAA+ superfamily ATPase